MKQTTKTLLGLVVLLLVAGAIGGAALWTGKDEEKKAGGKGKKEKRVGLRQGPGQGAAPVEGGAARRAAGEGRQGVEAGGAGAGGRRRHRRRLAPRDALDAEAEEGPRRGEGPQGVRPGPAPARGGSEARWGEGPGFAGRDRQRLRRHAVREEARRCHGASDRRVSEGQLREDGVRLAGQEGGAPR